MTDLFKPVRFFLFFTSVFFFTTNAKAQVDDGSELFKTLQAKDSLIFDISFNTCDVSQFENLLTSDFEFYHDISGITKTRAAFIESIRNGICNLDYKPRRELVEGSLQVFPLKQNGKVYGAIQTGKHRFFAIEKNKPEYFTSVARFTHLWLLENGTWKLKRALSYDHLTKDIPAEQNNLADAAMEQWIRELNVPALGLGIIREGKLKQVKVYGELSKGEPAPYNTIFNAASLAKPVTAMVALKLVSMGKWSLDEPLHKYWTDPDLKKDPRHKKLTTRHVLSQQSGFPNWRSDSGLAFEFDPGTKYQYSGEGIEYLRKALEKKFKTTLDKLAATLLFEPLQMTDTRFFWDEKMNESRFAKWHNAEGKLYETYKNKSANGADDLLTTVEDYGRFLVSVMQGEGLSEEVFREMTSQQVKTKEDKYFGLGWEVYDLGNGEYALSHGGADKGVQALVFILPESGDGLLIFTNVDDGYKVYERLIKTHLGANGQKLFDIEMGN
ncbi:hypothetical protein GCM10027293_28060 [Pontibacter aydingkolensis]